MARACLLFELFEACWSVLAVRNFLCFQQVEFIYININKSMPDGMNLPSVFTQLVSCDVFTANHACCLL